MPSILSLYIDFVLSFPLILTSRAWKNDKMQKVIPTEACHGYSLKVPAPRFKTCPQIKDVWNPDFDNSRCKLR